MGATLVRIELEEAARAWERELEQDLTRTVVVEFGRSRTLPLQTRRPVEPSARLCIRMHTMFASAPDVVRKAVARWLRSGRRARAACELLDRWIAERLRELPPPPPRANRARSRGAHHDLEQLAEGLWERFFGQDFATAGARPTLTWGQAGSRRSRRSLRSLRLGSYAREQHLVRLHPLLDRASVPEWYVRFVLFHEILHAALPPVRGANARWIHHSREFRRRERDHPDYARALEWEKRLGIR